jgi:hypothetical protein
MISLLFSCSLNTQTNPLLTMIYPTSQPRRKWGWFKQQIPQTLFQCALSEMVVSVINSLSCALHVFNDVHVIIACFTCCVVIILVTLMELDKIYPPIFFKSPWGMLEASLARVSTFLFFSFMK